jgi:uroporphyrinogen-III synthase
MTDAARGALAGKGIVVTRPLHQSDSLAARLDAAGARTIVFPTIAIGPPADLPALAAVVDRLEQYDLAIFISPNAAREAMRAITARRAWPAKVAVATIGRGGERELARHGLNDVIAPARFDSEGLLELPALRAVAGKRIVIFRGDGGRELLAETLRARGALVEYAACYQRSLPDADAAPLLAAWTRGEIDAVTVSSSEGLHNLQTLIGEAGRGYLSNTPLFVPHPRIERAAREGGLAHVHLTAQGDDGLFDGLCARFAAAG